MVKDLVDLDHIFPLYTAYHIKLIFYLIFSWHVDPGPIDGNKVKNELGTTMRVG